MSFITFSGFLNWIFKHNKAAKPWMEMNLKSLLLWAPAEISCSPCYCLSREELQTYQMWSLGFRLGLKCLAEVLASWNAALQSPCSKEIKDRISNEGGGFLASPRRAGRVLHYCCICPSLQLRTPVSPGLYEHYGHKRLANVCWVTCCQQAHGRSACYCSPFALMHHFTVSLVDRKSVV